jgi:hypothetical protein
MQYALDLAYVRQVKTALIEAGVTKPLNSAQVDPISMSKTISK